MHRLDLGLKKSLHYITACNNSKNPQSDDHSFSPTRLTTLIFTARRYTRKRGLCCHPDWVSVRLSVCLSVTLVDCIHMAEDIVKLLSRPGSAIILVSDPRRRYPIYPIPRRTPSAGGGHKILGGGKILRFSTEITVYRGNGTR